MYENCYELSGYTVFQYVMMMIDFVQNCPQFEHLKETNFKKKLAIVRNSLEYRPQLQIIILMQLVPFYTKTYFELKVDFDQGNFTKTVLSLE